MSLLAVVENRQALGQTDADLISVSSLMNCVILDYGLNLSEPVSSL